MLRVADKCGRSGRYRVLRLAVQIGWDGKLTDWLYDLTRDCPRKQNPGLSEPCGAKCPDLPKCFEKEERALAVVQTARPFPEVRYVMARINANT